MDLVLHSTTPPQLAVLCDLVGVCGGCDPQKRKDCGSGDDLRVRTVDNEPRRGLPGDRKAVVGGDKLALHPIANGPDRQSGMFPAMTQCEGDGGGVDDVRLGRLRDKNMSCCGYP